MSELERKVLSKMLDPKECNTIWDMGLRAEAFEDITCREAFKWMSDYWRDSNMLLAPTWVVMEHEFPTLKLSSEVEEATEWMVGALQQRLLVNKTQELLRECADALDADPEATIGMLWRGAYEIAEEVVPRNTRSNMIENIEERRARYAHREEDHAQGAPFGLEMVDDHTGGIRPGELAAGAGFTKVGKTWALVASIVKGQELGFDPVIFTLEMDRQSLEDRIDAVTSGVSYTRLHDGELLPDELRRLHDAQDRRRDLGHNLYVERPQRGERTVKGMTSRARQLGSRYVLIDQLSWIDPEHTYASDNSGLRMKHGDIMYALKDEISRDNAGLLPCYLAVQLNRDTMRSRDNGGRGEMHNFANSSFIEQTVDHAIGLWRNDNMRSNNLMGIDIMGSRRCDRQSWLAEWRLGERTRIQTREIYTE